MHESELARLLEGTADAAFAVDLQGRIRTWNTAAARMFVREPSSAIEQPCAAIINGRGESGTQVCRQDCVTLQCARGSLASPGGESSKEITNFDMEVRPQGRSPFWVNVSILIAADSHTERCLAVHFVRDVANRKRAEHFTAEVVGLVHQLAFGKHSGELPPTLSLTVQERRILELLRDGNGTEEIANKLRISVGTLRNHIHHLDRKLGTHGRLAALTQALRRGLI